MTTTTPTVADEIERYLRTGDTDPYHAAWSSPSLYKRAQLAAAREAGTAEQRDALAEYEDDLRKRRR